MRKKKEIIEKEEALEQEDFNMEDVDIANEMQELEDDVKTKKKKLPAWVIVPIIAIIALVCYGISLVSGGKKDTATELATAKVTQEDIKEVYNVSGTIDSNKKKVFYSPVNAPIETCNAKVGQAVNKGDLLVAFDTTDLEKNNRESELNQLSTAYGNQATKEAAAKGNEASAKSIASLKKQISKKEAEIKKLKSSSEKSQKEAAKTLVKLQSQLTENKNNQTSKSVEAASAKTTLTTLVGKCADKGYPTSESEIEKALNNSATPAEEITLLGQLKQAYAASKKAEKELAAFQSQQKQIEAQISSTGGSGASELASAQAELATLKSSLSSAQNTATDSGITGGQAKGMEVSEDLAKLSTDSVKELLKKGKKGLRAEFSGVISDVQAAEGAAASQGMALYTLVSNEDVVVDLEVPAEDFDKLRENETALIKIQDKDYQGTLTQINKIAVANEKGTKVIGAQVKINNPDDDIFIGVTVKTLLTVAQKSDVLAVPGEAINTSTDGDFVYIIKDGKVKKVNVEVGISSDSKAEILSGLKKGDQVVTDMSTTIKDGMKATAKKES